MNLTSGQLYFINEQDIQSNTRSNYYKIGIVRDADNRDSHDRLLEHQTGNPRKLLIVETLKMPAVEAVETTLHYLFARNRVMGEWMCFTESELATAVEKAKELAGVMESNIKNFHKSEELKSKESNGKILESTEEAEEYYSTAMNFKEVLASCKEILDEYSSYLKKAVEIGVSVEGKATIQERAGAKVFDEALFLEKYPDLHKQYSSVNREVKGNFIIKSNSEWAFDISTLDSDQVDLMNNFKQQLETPDYSMEYGFSLHSQFLGVLEIQKYAEWESTLANINLRVLTGEADGIKDICTWKRKIKENIRLDKKQIQNNHPVEYNECVVQRAGNKAMRVNPNIAQPQ